MGLKAQGEKTREVTTMVLKAMEKPKAKIQIPVGEVRLSEGGGYFHRYTPAELEEKKNELLAGFDKAKADAEAQIMKVKEAEAKKVAEERQVEKEEEEAESSELERARREAEAKAAKKK